MNLELRRRWFTDASTIGELYVDGVFECYTLEDVVRPEGVKVRGETAIQAGSYDLTITYSQRFQKRMPLLLSVPMFSGIRIHSGNTDHDTEGCILVGQQKADDAIIRSRAAFDALFSKLCVAIEHEPIRITISNEAEQQKEAHV